MAKCFCGHLPHNGPCLEEGCPCDSQKMFPVDLAFVIQDPCGEPAVELARQVLQLITDRDDVTVAALLPELRYLNMKYPRAVDAPVRIEGSKHQRRR